MKQLRTVVRFALSNEWLDKDPFEGFKCKTVVKDRGFLTGEELQTLETKEFGTERLKLTRDIFVFSCYTGLRYSDVEKLTKENLYVGNDAQVWLTIATTKTGERCNFPVLPKALAIIRKYENSPECTIKKKLLPVRTNQKMNEYLKEIADLCKIKKKVTFHLARHTFATTVTLANGVSLETIMKLLGHRSSRTTQIYAKMVDKRVAEEITTLKTVLTKNNNYEHHTF